MPAGSSAGGPPRENTRRLFGLKRGGGGGCGGDVGAARFGWGCLVSAVCSVSLCLFELVKACVRGARAPVSTDWLTKRPSSPTPMGQIMDLKVDFCKLPQSLLVKFFQMVWMYAYSKFLLLKAV